MVEISLNAYHAVGIGAVMWWLGKQITTRIGFLNKFCIPAPLVGGLCFAILNMILYSAGIAQFSLDGTFGTLFMSIFFTTVGFSASVPALKKGGKAVFIVLVVSIVVIVCQNLIGGGIMVLMGRNPLYGIACGSLALIGGPGTAAGIGPTLVAAGAEGATEIGVAAATFGMVSGSILGGPCARMLVVSHKVKTPLSEGKSISDSEVETEKELMQEGGGYYTNSATFLKAFLLIMLSLGIGEVVSEILSTTLSINFPAYIGSMAMGMVIRNVMEFGHITCPEQEIDSLGNASLNTFLAITVSSMQLWMIVELALPMVVCLVVQLIFLFAVCYFIVFRLLGSDYDAAVTTAGFLGMGLGTASNAMVSMQAVTSKYGPCMSAFFAVPVAGLFMDFFNAAIIAANIVLWS